jgi:excisionase family DNA binding protein
MIEDLKIFSGIPVPQELYSIDQVASLLGLHVKTVRGYVREGRLKATRIGKQYRIAREDLEALTGRRAASLEGPPARRHRHVEVSSVVEIDAIAKDAADRMTTFLMAAVKGRPHGDQPVRIDTIYDEARARLKVIVTGGVDTTRTLLGSIKALAED